MVDGMVGIKQALDNEPLEMIAWISVTNKESLTCRVSISHWKHPTIVHNITERPTI